MKTEQNFGTCAIILNSEGRVLVGKRKNSFMAGKYGLPGGRVEINEPLDIAINREVREETGLTNLDLKFVGVVRENQGEYDFMHFVFTANGVTSEPRLMEPDKCEGWEWLSMDKMNEEWLVGHKKAIEMWLEKKTLKDVVR